MCSSSFPPRASSSPVFFKALAVSCFSSATSKPPSHKWRRGKGPATSQHDRGLLALVHPPSSRAPSPPSPSPPPPPGEKHKLDITAREKVIFILWQALSVQSYFRRMLSSVATHNISSFVRQEHKRLETTSTKQCSSPGELAVISLMCLEAA